MGRPRQSEGLPGGKQRIKDAFWEVCRATSLEKVTVKAVCERAAINKTTFYYHYPCLEELLAEVESECIPTEMPHAVMDEIRAGNAVVSAFGMIENDPERRDKVSYLLSSRGDPLFARRLKNAMRAQWCEALGRDYAALSGREKLIVELVMGASVSVLAARGDGMELDFDEFAEVASEAVVPLLRKIIDEGETARA